MKVLVTGGAGYLGSVLVPKLLKKNFQVVVLDNFMFNQLTLTECCKDENFSIYKGDCRNKDLLKKLVKDCDFIIPLAALVGAPICNIDPLATKSINQDAIELLTGMLSTEQKIIMPVTNSGYGVGAKDKFCDENSPLNPITLYGQTKVNAEKIVLNHGNSVTLRLATVFGMSSRMRTDLLVNDFTYRAYNDRALIIFEGHFKRNYVHIQDVANAMIFCLENFDSMKNNVYNCGLEDANLSKIELCETIKVHLPNFVFHEAEIGEDPDKRDYIVSNKKILSSGFKFEWSLDRGIKELIKGYTYLNNNKYSNI